MPVRFYLHDPLPSSEASELHTAYYIQGANLITDPRIFQQYCESYSYGIGSFIPASLNPLSLNAQLSHLPQALSLFW